MKQRDYDRERARRYAWPGVVRWFAAPVMNGPLRVIGICSDADPALLKQYEAIA